MKSLTNILCLVLVNSCLVTSLISQQYPMGYWAGTLSMGTSLSYKVYLEFRPQGDSCKGWFDIPAQGANGLAIRNIRLVDSILTFDVRVSAGGSLRFQANYSPKSIRGSVKQAGMRLQFAASPTPANTSPAYKALGIREDSVYTEEEVRIRVNDEVELAGSLVLPKGKAGFAFPCVLLLSGSGQQDRDENIHGFRGFKILAEALAQKGIASLRCDDRCTGGSRGDVFNITTRELANDASVCIAWLKKRSEIQKDAIALLGHSEGGIMAGMLAAERSDVAALILMASSAVRGDSLIKHQIAAIMSAEAKTLQEIDSTLAEQEKVYVMVRSDQRIKEYENTLRQQVQKDYASMPAGRKKMIEDSIEAIEAMVSSRLGQLTMPWFRYFIDYNPAQDLYKLRVPVLALFGEKDVQVPYDLNKEAMEKAFNSAAGNKDATITVIPSANHLFQEAQSGVPSEYASLKKEYAPGVVQSITNWCADKLRR